MSFFQRRMGGEWGARTPVESREYRTVGKETDVVVPRAQAFWMAFPLAMAVIVTLISPALIGPRIFYVAACITALAALLWSIAFESHWLDRITLPALVGVVAWCMWEVSDAIGICVAEEWQPLTGILAVGLLTFFWTWTAALWLAFVQELAQRSPFQEQSIWQALGELLVWRVKTPRPVARDPVLLHSHGAQNGGKLQAHELPPEAELTLLEQFLMIVKAKGTLARDRTMGAMLADGTKLTKTKWEDCIGRLGEAGYIIDGGRGYAWAPGASADVALQQFSHPTPQGEM